VRALSEGIVHKLFLFYARRSPAGQIASLLPCPQLNLPPPAQYSYETVGPDIAIEAYLQDAFLRNREAYSPTAKDRSTWNGTFLQGMSARFASCNGKSGAHSIGLSALRARNLPRPSAYCSPRCGIKPLDRAVVSRRRIGTNESPRMSAPLLAGFKRSGNISPAGAKGPSGSSFFGGSANVPPARMRPAPCQVYDDAVPRGRVNVHSPGAPLKSSPIPSPFLPVPLPFLSIHFYFPPHLFFVFLPTILPIGPPLFLHLSHFTQRPSIPLSLCPLLIFTVT